MCFRNKQNKLAIHSCKVMRRHSQFVFLPFPDLLFIFFDAPSGSESPQRGTSKLTLLSEGSGDGELFTLLCRLTLGVVLFEVIGGLSVRKTAFL